MSFADASLLEQQLSFHPPFQSSIQVNSTYIEQNVSIKKIWMPLSLFKMIVI